MPDKDIMALIKKREEERPWAAVDTLVTDQTESGNEAVGLRGALATLAGDWRETADLYDKAKLKGATTTYIVPLRHAAAELDKVIKGLESPRATAAGPRPRTQQCLDQAPHERHPNGVGTLTGDELVCIGVPPLRPLGGLDALIADSRAAGKGAVRVLPNGVTYDSTGEVTAFTNMLRPGDDTSGWESEQKLSFPGQATDAEVTAYLRGEASDIPGSSPLVPSSVRSLAEIAEGARATVKPIGWRSLAPSLVGQLDETLQPAPPYCRTCDLDLHRCPGCGEPIAHDEGACAQCNLLHAEPNPSATAEEIATAGLVLDPHGSEHGPDDRNYSRLPNQEGTVQPVISPRPIVPESWANTTTTPDGHRITGAPIPPTPLLGQPGDAGSGYSPSYVPPGGVPMTYAELMTAVPLAVLPPHLSHSQIGTVGECPTKYRASRIGRTSDANGAPYFEPITQIPQWAFIGGHAVHAFIEGWERSVVEEHGRTLAVDGFTPEDAKLEWDVVFGKEIELVESTSSVPRTNWRASKQGAEGETWWNANGPLMLSRYVKARPADPTWNAYTVSAEGFELALELERTVSVQTPYGPLPYRAILDRVTQRNPLPGDPSNYITLIVRDYKSGDRMPEDTSQLGEYGQVLRLLGVPPQVKILGTFFNARKGTWTPEVDLEQEGWTLDWFTHHVASGHAGRLALTTGPTPVRTSNYCGGCPVRWACPVKGVKR